MDTNLAIRRNMWAAFIVMVVICGVVGLWAARAPIEGAVVANGTVIVEGNVKKIQHPSGGIVGEILVKEGGLVQAGDVLVRLDDTVTRANLAIVVNDLTAQRARLARLRAMRDEQKEPPFPADLAAAAVSDLAIRSILDGEARLSRFKLTTRDEQKAQLAERVKQLGLEIRGLDEQRSSMAGQLAIARKEYADLKPLYDSGGLQRTRMTTLEREVLRSQGVLGDIVAKIAQSQAKIAETELQITQIDNDFMTEVMKELRETETKIVELQERKIAAEDQLRRIELKAPSAGRIHQLAVHTVGGVISPSETLMTIVPTAERMIVEVRINPADIDQLIIGQETRVRFSAFNRRTTEELTGTVTRVGADLTHEPQTNQSYYVAGVSVPDSELATLNGLKLMPGMPAEVFIKTGDRTLVSYLLRPLNDQMARAFRER